MLASWTVRLNDCARRDYISSSCVAAYSRVSDRMIRAGSRKRAIEGEFIAAVEVVVPV